MPLTQEEYKAKCEAFKKEINAPSILIMAVSEDREHICHFIEAQNFDRAKFIFFIEAIINREKAKISDEFIALGKKILDEIRSQDNSNQISEFYANNHTH